MHMRAERDTVTTSQSVCPSTRHTLVLCLNECIIVKIFPPSDKSTLVFLSATGGTKSVVELQHNLWGGRKIWRTIASLENYFEILRPPRPFQKSHFGGSNVFLLQFQYKKTLANCNKASIKKSSAHHRNCSPLNRPTPDFYRAICPFR